MKIHFHGERSRQREFKRESRVEEKYKRKKKMN
jgi:hypothetical protein